MKPNKIRPFLPSKDFSLSKQFYLDLGFELLWEDENLCLFGLSNSEFFLQDYYVEDWANNIMMQLLVFDLDEVYKQYEEVAQRYQVDIKPILPQEYGRTFHLKGPCNELWYITESPTVVTEL